MQNVTRPDLTVVIPHYNQPEELASVLNDLYNQVGITLEVFVVDDASVIPCDNIVNGFRERGLSVSLLQQSERQYTLAARLRGMHAASGRWLAFMDSDDGLCSSTAFSSVINEAETHRVDILHFITLTETFDGFQQVWRNASPFSDSILKEEEVITRWIDEGCPSHSVWNKLYSRELYLRLLSVPHDVKILRIEDFYLTAYFMFFAKCYTTCTIPVYQYTPPDRTHLEKVAARAIDAMHMYFTLPKKLAKLGLSSTNVSNLRLYLRKMTTLNTGRMSRFIAEAHDIEDFLCSANVPTLPGVKAILQYATMKEFILALTIANASNGRKAQDLYNQFV